MLVLIVLTGLKYKDLGGLHLAILMTAAYLFSIAMIDKTVIYEKFVENMEDKKESDDEEESDNESDDESENESENEDEEEEEENTKKEEFKDLMYATPSGGMMSNWDSKWSDVFDKKINPKSKVSYQHLV